MDKSDKSIRAMKIFTFLACIAVFITVFVVAFQMFDIDKVEVEEDEIDINTLAQKSMTASIMSINFDKKIVKLYDFKKGLAYDEEFTLSNQTKYLDKDSKLIDKESFSVGVIADITYTEDSNIISKLMIAPASWTISDVSDFEFDYIKNELEINKVKYILDKEYTLTYNGSKASYKDLAEGNVIIKASGYDKNVLGIEIIKYLGRINLTYPDNLKGAIVQVGNNKILNIEDVNDTYLVPDNYRLVISKKGVDDIILDCKVEEDKVTNIDVNEVKVKTSVLNININVSDYTVDIKSNDGIVNDSYTDNLSLNPTLDLISSNSLTLPYGTYSLTFNKDGYKGITKTVTLDGKTKIINVTMLTVSEAEKEVSQDKVKITITTEPSDANIYVDGEYRADGKLTVRLTLGTHMIKIVKSGYEGIERSIDVTEDKEYKFVLTSDNAFESPTGELAD